jgi:hypothetical protein
LYCNTCDCMEQFFCKYDPSPPLFKPYASSYLGACMS